MLCMMSVHPSLVQAMVERLPYVVSDIMLRRSDTFPSALGPLRDPPAVHKQWRTVRSCLKLNWVTSHTFWKHGHPPGRSGHLRSRRGRPAGTCAGVHEDVYMSRKAVHFEVADVMDRIVR
jgi:hypothetical protein